tara:strand:+ start:72 stop:221 length:150 start_codon:yes stop_codon:yes gene_type:complete
MNTIIYELIVIGGGISSCTLVSNFLAKGFKGKISTLLLEGTWEDEVAPE